MSTRLEIVNTILQFERSFKQADVCRITNHSRQLVSYHIKQLVGEGYLQPVGQKYFVDDREGLIQNIIENLGSSKRQPMFATGLWIPDNVDKLKNFIAKSLALKILEPKDGASVRRALIVEINETIESLQNAKRELTERQMTRSTALRQFPDETSVRNFWGNVKVLLPDIDITLNKEDWVSAVNNARDDGE